MYRFHYDTTTLSYRYPNARIRTKSHIALEKGADNFVASLRSVSTFFVNLLGPYRSRGSLICSHSKLSRTHPAYLKHIVSFTIS